ncbi:hypothetical protein [Ferribacterium limneticum]|uniref:hypothetical protein n=1 Tax=Ferribacterium limneticum TaxID=76259 RepID=UPI001CFB1E12|nr:hypothetical protein [Ferribacterium limneticum]UCV19252.1 hypothetical protein KI610_01295 [Ferribacterium limneticum]
MESSTLLGKEWQTLQDNHEQHEQNALFIKLACLALSIAGLATGLPLTWIAFTVLICWIQEGIFKTYQSRLADRLLSVEARLAQPNPTPSAMQLHTDWLASRPTGGALLGSYLVSALRPTVAFPYLPILLMLGLGRWLSWL